MELTRLGRAGEQQTGARRNARLGGAAGGIVLFPGRRLDGQVVDSDEPAQVIRVEGPVTTDVATSCRSVLSGPPTDTSTETVTLCWNSPVLGVPVNSRPVPVEMPDSVVPPVASFCSRGGGSTARSLIPMNRPR
ncbi:Uncharacterised protein [Mycobacteroides abscessus subsp. abscessus]|nr:Uncharacterised protein [Mycobacteroides abscessus subsp. abscessus]